MNFDELIRQFTALPPGTDNFLKVKDEMILLTEADPGHAAAYFLVYGFARSYVLLYEDQGISPEFAATAKTQLLGYMNRLAEAFHAGEAQDLIDAMNWIVLDYNKSGKIF
jgi:hypothetical protein